MRNELVISDKGQITLPKDLRKHFGLRAGDMVVFTVIDGAVFMTPKTIDFNELQGILGNPPKGPATLEEIDASVAQAAGRQEMMPGTQAQDSAA